MFNDDSRYLLLCVCGGGGWGGAGFSIVLVSFIQGILVCDELTFATRRILSFLSVQ